MDLGKTGGEGTDSDECRVAKAGIAGEAAKHAPGDGETGGIKHQLSNAHIKGRQQDRRGREGGDAGQHDQAHDGRTMPHREALNALPSNPLGRTRSIRTSNRNIATFGNAGPTY